MADGDIINKNNCRSKRSAALSTSVWTELAKERCSEILVVGATGGVYISDGGGLRNGSADPSLDTSVLVPADVVMPIRGLTNSNDLSALSVSGTPKLYYRTQYYTMSLQNG